ncbi:MAG: NYN domain-containing protein [Oscillospiraceae bacterium]|nr:NYN domain-containing protein [Oscillospiraceae bacterium]
MIGEKRLALLIDSDNVSAKYAQFILQEAAKFGELTYKRIYGDWEKGGNGWHYPALNNSIMPVQQTTYITGKNATDFSMIIDAMDILYTGNVDGFVLVTSDSDFTRLAIRLREAGKTVIGIGEVKTPLPFTSSCHRFIYLNQLCEPAFTYDEKLLRKAVLDYVSENDDGKLDLLKIQGFLTSKYGNINYSSIGFNRFSNFIDSFPELRRNSTFVTLKNSPKKAAKSAENLPTDREITEVIVGYLKRKDGGHEDISKIEQYVTATLGKIDYSRFGSKRFAKFLDKQSALYRKSTSVYLAENAPKPAAKPEPKKSGSPEEKLPSDSEIIDVIVNYLQSAENGASKLSDVEKQVESSFGKVDFSRFGAKTLAKFLDMQSELSRTNNSVALSENNSEQKAQITTEASANTPEKSSKRKNKRSSETEVTEKPELNTVKREIQIQTVRHENSISLPALGKILREKYGDNYLKDIGAITLKQLVTAVAGVKLKGNSIKIDEDFIDRTEQIEQFVCDFVAKNKKVSIKSLSTQIKKKFSGFDFTDYGYSRFSDFINAIDGVKADRYYVKTEQN